MPSPAGEGLGRGAFWGVGVLEGPRCRARACQPLLSSTSSADHLGVWDWGREVPVVPETAVWPQPDHGSSQVWDKGLTGPAPLSAGPLSNCTFPQVTEKGLLDSGSRSPGACAWPSL